MARIFISYRRADSRVITGRIHDRLAQAFDKNSIFKDVDNIPIGRDFRVILHQESSNCQVMLVIIGPNWLNAEQQGKRRLDDPDDFVRLEVETGLQSENVLVVPILVDNASMPTASELPESMKALAFNNSAVVRHDPDFHRDMDQLIAALQSVLNPQPNVTIAPKPDKPDRWTSSRILGAVIGLIGIIAVAAVTILPSLLDRQAIAATQAASNLIITQAPSITATDALQTETSIASVATQPVTPISTQTSVPPTVQSTQTSMPPTEVVLSPEEIALTPVTQNEDWTPIERDFDGVAMVLVPAGCFMMGYEDGDDDEGPIHEQCFSTPFWIDKYEVTNAQFKRFAGLADTQSQWLDEDHPRENITWDEAQQFCVLRGARLPSEAEWEYAARGPNNLIYPWGNAFQTVATTGNRTQMLKRPLLAVAHQEPHGSMLWI